MKKFLFVAALGAFLKFGVKAQVPALSSSEIFLELNKLSTLGNAMYIAAHPDDENTLLITWLSKEKNARVAYYAMTRGDGGQNLIGAEQGEYVGLIRTHELLEARKVDGGEQYFSRALDFGYSKSTDEALTWWGKDAVLSDLVYRIRKFKPDVLITRFPEDERAGHGHHSASAVLAREAFNAAGNPAFYPEQLKEVSIWQPKRLLWNSYNRGFTNTPPESQDYIAVPLGDFNPLLGESYTEIAARARSKHRSQGFGAAPVINRRNDFLMHMAGEPAKSDIFDGINTNWSRIPEGKVIETVLSEIIKNYDFRNPENSVSKLLEVYKIMASLPESVYKKPKLEACQRIIFACLGLYLKVNPASNFATPGQNVKLFAKAITRTDFPVKITGLKISGVAEKDTVLDVPLLNNQAFEFSEDIKIPSTAAISQPYWLQEKHGGGAFKISVDSLRNLPMSPDPLYATFSVIIGGQKMNFRHPVKYKYTEPSRGEIYKYFEIRPSLTVNFNQEVLVFNGKENRNVNLNIKNFSEEKDTEISLVLPQGWQVSPEAIKTGLLQKGEEKSISFTVTPTIGSSDGDILVSVDGKAGLSIKTMTYEHIPELNVFPRAKAKAISLDIKTDGNKIGYIMGAGDEVAACLTQIGYQVSYLNEVSILDNLSDFDAIIVGVRAFNTEKWLVGSHNTLMNYVKNGGNLVVQYQTADARFKDSIGPYSFTIGRGRVTDETADISFLNPNDSILNFPNKITKKDFDGWIQERGLYFAQAWSDKYNTVLGMNDKGENLQEGALLYAPFGKGNFVFTGLSLFRQLPAGIPGAYRLMANLISIKKK